MKSLIMSATRSWRSTALGTIIGLDQILGQIKFLVDSDATTNPDWNIVVGGVLVIWFAVVVGDHKAASKAGA